MQYRSLIERRRDEGSGEVESLAGRLDIKKMGDRAQRAKPKTLAEKTDKEKQAS